MSKERIEEIKSMYENWLTSSHMGWLIEQAKRAQKLEERLNALITLKKSDANALSVLTEQNKHYREAIEFGIEYLKNSDIRQVQLVVTALKSSLEGEE